MPAGRIAALGKKNRADETRDKPGTAQVITLDGPSGAGKSTLGSALAKELGWAFLDSGLVYRGVAQTAMTCGVEVNDTAALSHLAMQLKFEVDGGVVNIQDIGPGRLQDRAVAEFASGMATQAQVRRVLTSRMQTLIRGTPYVVAGRDAGTAIVPAAPLRVFLDAPLDVRAKRRAAQSAECVLKTMKALQLRDQRDRAREAAPLQLSPETIVVDTSHQTPSEILATLCKLANILIN